LLVSARFPWPPVTGDRIRAVAWIEALASSAELTLVAPAGAAPAGGPAFRHVPAARSLSSLAVAGARTLAEGLPFTALLAAGYGWRKALMQARREGGPFDVAVVLLARLDPWVFGTMAARRLVFDAVDSLAANLRARASAAGPAARWLWRWEGDRTARLERDAARRYDRVLVVAEAERAAFGAGAEAIFHGVELAAPGTGARDFDVGFWGRLAYFANRDAAGVLLDEIWPLVRAERPEATLLIAGADAPAFIRRRNGREGITVVSPMEDRRALLRRVRVALFPLRHGSGQSNKVLEAGEASCALVATPQAMRGLDDLVPLAAVASTPAALAARTVELLGPAGASQESGRRLREAVEAGYSRQSACRSMAEVALGPAVGHPLSGPS
jgi:hypothetical protein